MGKLEEIITSEERTEEKKKDIITLAEHIAETIMMLIATKHEPHREWEQAEKIFRQVMLTTTIEEQDTQYLLHLINEYLPTVKKEWVLEKARATLRSLQTQELILRDINYIINDKNHKQSDQLTNLIAKLLVKIEEAHLDLTRIAA